MDEQEFFIAEPRGRRAAHDYRIILRKTQTSFREHRVRIRAKDSEYCPGCGFKIPRIGNRIHIKPGWRKPRKYEPGETPARWSQPLQRKGSRNHCGPKTRGPLLKEAHTKLSAEIDLQVFTDSESEQLCVTAYVVAPLAQEQLSWLKAA